MEVVVFKATSVASNGFITLSRKPLSTQELYDNSGIQRAFDERIISPASHADKSGTFSSHLGGNQVFELRGDVSRDGLVLGGCYSPIEVLAGAVGEEAQQVAAQVSGFFLILLYVELGRLLRPNV